MDKKRNLIKRLKVFNIILALLSVMNIIVLINRNQSYALFRRNVFSKKIVEIHTASEFPPRTAVYTIKKTLGKEQGIIGVTTNNEKTIEKNSKNIREYRYSGSDVNNYVYFNCITEVEQTASNCEKWRIIGIFKDEDGNEHLKIVSDKVVATKYWDSSSSYKNNWEDSEVNKYLNETYFNSLSDNAQKMIGDTKYYLGTLYYNNNGFRITPKEAYEQERDVKDCVKNTGTNATASGCRVWSGNAATWTGKIGLLYPSDYAFTADNTFWDTVLYSYDSDSGAMETSWLYKANHSVNSVPEWLISPGSYVNYYVAGWFQEGFIGDRYANDTATVRPTFYLDSDITIISGDGSSDKPYALK